MINRASVQLWGNSGTIGRAAKIGWEIRGWLPEVNPILWHGSDFIYTKNSARPGSGFSLHKEYVGAILKKMAIFFKENALRITDFSNRHTIFENWSLVDFEIGNERKSHNIASTQTYMLKNFPAARA